MIKSIVKLFVALNSNISKTQIAAGFAWGLLLGLIPSGNLIWITLFIVSFFIKNNHAAQLVVIAFIKIIFPAIAPMTDALGWFILNFPGFVPFFTKLYNMPVAPFTKFNNTLVAGGLCSGIILWFPLFFLVYALVPFYRNTLAPKISQSKIMIFIKKIPLLSQIIKTANTITNFK
jgi:uncharacterized protein (TIGR03546 family)